MKKTQSHEVLETHNDLSIDDTEKWTALNLIGVSTSFKKILSLIKNSSKCDAPVLIEGETGTGKEVIARAIHYQGSRKDYPFIPLNCGAIPDYLIENELFGHEKGAYTDAKLTQEGLIAQAEGGTLFLDEIEALPLKGQVVLLRFIEDHEIRPLGAGQTKTINIRIIAASNVPLSELVEKGLFRKDLFFRLNLISIYLSPLRERSSDIRLLAEFFMDKYHKYYQQPNKCLSPEIYNWMINYTWPGNIRELENFIHRMFLLSSESWESQIIDLPYQDQSNNNIDFSEYGSDIDFEKSFNEAKKKAINDFEKRYLSCLIDYTCGNVTKAAETAHKERRALGKLLKKHNIDPSQFRNK